MGDHLHFLRPFIPERLVFCIDLCNEMNGIEFSKSRKNTFTRLDLVKHMLKMFVHLKHKMNPRHEFAIVCLTDAAIWFQDFTSDVELLAKKVSTLQTQGDFPRFNMSSVFDLFAKKVALPQVTMEDLKRGGADYLYRVLFIYSRTTVVPEWIDGREMADRLLATPVFFFDGLYLHKKPSKENNPQGVYDFLTDIESLEENSYFSETHQSLRRIYTNFTLLLANPLQRPEQDKFKTTLASSKPVKD